jgi:hypothetical protein
MKSASGMVFPDQVGISIASSTGEITRATTGAETHRESVARCPDRGATRRGDS